MAAALRVVFFVVGSIAVAAGAALVTNWRGAGDWYSYARTVNVFGFGRHRRPSTSQVRWIGVSGILVGSAFVLVAFV